MGKSYFSEKIRSLRLKKKMTQNDLSEKIGLSPKTISKWEVGVSQPDLSTLVKLSEIFGVSVDNLLMEKPIVKNTRNRGKAEKTIQEEPESVLKKEEIKENEKTIKKIKNNSFKNLIFSSISLAMGIGVLILNILDSVDENTSFIMLGLGLISISFIMIDKYGEK